MTKWLASSVLLALLAAASAQTSSAPAPASAPAGGATTSAAASTSVPATASAPATTSAPTDPAILKILQAQEEAAAKYQTFRWDVDYNLWMAETDEKEARTGWIALQNAADKADSKFRITFETLKLEDGAPTKEQVDYAFAGQWLTVAKHRIKQIIRYQVAAEGEKIEPLRLGKGPFPMPIGQKTEDVLKYFQVATRPAKADDPKNTDFLKLTTRPQYKQEMSFAALEIWFDRDTHLPVKLVTVGRNSDISTVVLKNPQLNKPLSPDLFTIPRPAGWEYRVEPLEKAKPENTRTRQ